MHIHQFGDLSGADITANSGSHFNPFGNNHAYPEVANRHVGDLGNLRVGLDGIGNMTNTLNLISLKGINSVVGRSVIIHANQDDGVTQPTGNSGDKIGACVIGTVDTLPPANVPCTPINFTVTPTPITPNNTNGTNPNPRSSGIISYLSLGVLFLISILLF